MDVSTYVLLGTVIVGVNQAVAHLRASDWWGFVTVLLAGLTGLIFGAFGVEGLTVWTGVAAGFGSAGTVTLVGKLSASSAAAVTPNTTATNPAVSKR